MINRRGLQAAHSRVYRSPVTAQFESLPPPPQNSNTENNDASYCTEVARQTSCAKDPRIRAPGPLDTCREVCRVSSASRINSTTTRGFVATPRDCLCRVEMDFPYEIYIHRWQLVIKITFCNNCYIVALRIYCVKSMMPITILRIDTARIFVWSPSLHSAISCPRMSCHWGNQK